VQPQTVTVTTTNTAAIIPAVPAQPQGLTVTTITSISTITAPGPPPQQVTVTTIISIATITAPTPAQPQTVTVTTTNSAAIITAPTPAQPQTVTVTTTNSAAIIAASTPSQEVTVTTFPTVSTIRVPIRRPNFVLVTQTISSGVLTERNTVFLTTSPVFSFSVISTLADTVLLASEETQGDIVTSIPLETDNTSGSTPLPAEAFLSTLPPTTTDFGTLNTINPENTGVGEVPVAVAKRGENGNIAPLGSNNSFSVNF
ncbi:hypothetical protein AX774_g1073, partial [Zancudomyces culisetae]